MRFSIRNPKADARHSEAVARERRELRGQSDAPEPTNPSAILSLDELDELAALPDADLGSAEAQFRKMLFDVVVKNLGLGHVMIELHYDPLPVPSGPFSAHLEHAGEGQPLTIECKHDGDGVVTYTLGSLRARFRPGDIIEGTDASLEELEGPVEGDPRWEALLTLRRQRDAGLAEASWQSEIAELVGLSTGVPPEAQERADAYRSELSGAGSDEDRLVALGDTIVADTSLPHLLQQELLGDIDRRRGC